MQGNPLNAVWFMDREGWATLTANLLLVCLVLLTAQVSMLQLMPVQMREWRYGKACQYLAHYCYIYAPLSPTKRKRKK